METVERKISESDHRNPGLEIDITENALKCLFQLDIVIKYCTILLCFLKYFDDQALK